MAYAESDREGQAWIAAFREGLQKFGWAEGRNIRIDLRWAADDVELMQQFAKELVAHQPDIILTQNTPSTAAMLRTNTQHPHHFRPRFRPGRQRLRREFFTTGRQRHRFRQF